MWQPVQENCPGAVMGGALTGKSAANAGVAPASATIVAAAERIVRMTKPIRFLSTKPASPQRYYHVADATSVSRAPHWPGELHRVGNLDGDRIRVCRKGNGRSW